MMLTFHLDADTLLASESFICAMFAMVLFVLARRFGDMRGSMRLAQAFMASGFGTFFFLTVRMMPLAVNVLVANSALMLANLLFYDGIDALLHTRPRLRYPAAIAILTLIPLAWFSAVDNRLEVRIVLLAAADCLMQIWLFTDLIRCSRKGLAVYLLAMSVLLSMTTDVLRGLAIALNVSPASFLQSGSVQAAYMVTGVLAACGLGIFSLILVVAEVMNGMERSALRDPLTGALNRRGIEDLLKGELDRTRRAGTPLALALLDIDNFKSINDTWGHPVGDIILCDVVGCITASLRSYDSCGRIGGDEFLILLPGSSAAAAATICNRILQHVAALRPRKDVEISPTVSMGFTEYVSSDTPESIIARADRALYVAKREGRNRVSKEIVFAPGMRKEKPAPVPGASPRVPVRRDTRPGRLSV